MPERRISTPAGSAGIFRFYDVEGKGIKISPQLVMGLTLAFIVLIIVLKFVVKI